MPTHYDVMVVWTDQRAPGAAGRSTPQSRRLARYANREEAERNRDSMPAPATGVRYEVWTVRR